MDFNPQQIEQLNTQLRVYLGETVFAALTDRSVTDITCSEDGVVWLTQHKKGNRPTETILPEPQRRLAINTMASLLGKTCNAETPDLSGNLFGVRIEASVPPSGGPAFFIRRFAPVVFTFGNYLEMGTLTLEQVQTLIHHIEKRSNILFSGATGSGKTTLLDTCVAELADSPDHVVSIEDTKELKLRAKHVSRFYTSETLSLRHQVKESMRRKPDRLIIGEVRDGAALEMMKAFCTGHRGCMATVHADSAEGALFRLSLLCREVSEDPHWELIQQTFDVVCHMEMTGQGRKLVELKEVAHDKHLAAVPIRLEHANINT